MGSFGKLFIGFLIVVAVLGIIGLVMAHYAKKKGLKQKTSDNITENVADLNDRFNRARYMSEDGK